jgi:PAS domain S-box-containing protein
MIEQIQRFGSIRNYEAELRMKSGEVRNFSVSGEIISINDEPHLLATNRDITESKKIMEALRFSEECFSKAFNTSPVPMAITSLNEGRIIKANNSLCRNLDYNQEELIDRTTVDIGFWADISQRNRVQQMLIEKKSVYEIEIHFNRKTGEQRLGLYSAERLDVDGEPCILGILIDITELRQMEIEMTRLDRLNLVGEMAASIGHEIRNPMTTVRGYLQMLRENKDCCDIIDHFDLMIEELDRANSIITEFLSLAKNKMVDLQPRNLNQIITKLLPLIQARALILDHTIKLDLDEIPDLLLDKKEIRQLIFNMVNNGLESMHSSGEVKIKTFMEQGQVVLAVKDQGHGIDNKFMDRLGTPFFTTKEQGTGLGLAVCYRIAARHNAKIDIDTSTTGTTFYVRFSNPVVNA